MAASITWRPGRVNALLALLMMAGALICAPTPACALGDLLEDVDRAVRGSEAATDTPQAPDIRSNDYHNRPFAIRDYAGQNLVLTFLSPKCVKEAVSWLEGVQTSYLGDPEVAFVNVLYPGALPAFATRSASLKQIREHIDGYLDDVRQRMPPEEKQRLDRTDIRWLVDWRLDIHKRYDVEADRVHIFLIDRQGRIREHIGRRTPATERRLTEVIDELRRRPSDQ